MFSAEFHTDCGQECAGVNLGNSNNNINRRVGFFRAKAHVKNQVRLRAQFPHEGGQPRRSSSVADRELVGDQKRRQQHEYSGSKSTLLFGACAADGKSDH